MPIPFLSGRQPKLGDDMTVREKADISSATLLDSRPNTSKTSTVFFFVGDGPRMESDQHGQLRSRRRLRPQQSEASLTIDVSRNTRVPPPLSSPLPQRQWTQIPEAYRPSMLVQADEAPHVGPEPLHTFRHRLPPPQRALTEQPRPQATPPAARRRTPSSIVVREPTLQDQPDPSLLYPQLSPYDDPVRTQRAYQRAQAPQASSLQRSVSQPQSPSWSNPPWSPPPVEDLPSLGLPRAPTYPPSTNRRRMHTPSGSTGDAAFRDEQELAMFAAASVGLSPEGAFRPAHASIDTSNLPFGRDRGAPTTQPTRSNTLTAETPTTMRALEQLAQMPSGSSAQSRGRLGRSSTGLDLWLSSPTPTTPGISVLQTSSAAYPDVSPVDEELPDYQTSQAQAAAQSRQAAARRAEELQRRWRASSGNAHDRLW